MLLIVPLMALLLYIPEQAIPTLFFTVLIGTPILSLIGAIGVALTAGLRGGGVLLSLLVLPLYTPVLIFGAGAVSTHALGMEAEAHLSLLAALLVLSVIFTPWVTAIALRISLD